MTIALTINQQDDKRFIFDLVDSAGNPVLTADLRDIIFEVAYNVQSTPVMQKSLIDGTVTITGTSQFEVAITSVESCALSPHAYYCEIKGVSDTGVTQTLTTGTLTVADTLGSTTSTSPIIPSSCDCSQEALDAAVAQAQAAATEANQVAATFSTMIGPEGESVTIEADVDPVLILHEVSQDSTSRIYNNGYHLYLEHVSLAGGNALIELDPLPVDIGGHAVVRIGRNYVGTGDVRFSILPGGGVTTPEWEFNALSDSYMLRNQQGNLGLGTATPQRFFHMAHADPIIRMQDTDTGGLYAEIRADGAAGRLTFSADQGAAAAGSFINFLVDGQEYARIDEEGRLGIGTATGQRLLHMAGTDPIIRMQDTDTVGLYSEIRADGAAGRLTLSADVSGAGTGSFLSMFVSGQEHVRLDDTGRLGLGTTSPQRQLHISGVDPIIRLQDGDDGVYSEIRAEGPSGRFSISVDPNSAGTGDSYFSVLIDGTEQLTIDPSGNMDVRNGHIEIAGQKVVEARKTGWAVPSGTATRTSFTTSTATLEEVAERLKAVIDDLRAHGLIGA